MIKRICYANFDDHIYYVSVSNEVQFADKHIFYRWTIGSTGSTQMRYYRITICGDNLHLEDLYFFFQKKNLILIHTT